MSNLFAFNQAQESPISLTPSGRYDAQQQLWIADETSYAGAATPVVEPSQLVTHYIILDSSGPTLQQDISLD
jgi:hypothetical protein